MKTENIKALKTILTSISRLKSLRFKRFSIKRDQMGIVLRGARQPIVLLLMAALLIPVFAFGRLESVSAKTVAPAAALPAASSAVPIAAPPVAFAVSPGITTAPLTDFDTGNPSGSFSPGAAITGGYSAVASFFTAPPVPEGLGAARSVSPAFALSSSVAVSVGAFFGLIEPAPATINRKVTSAADSSDPSAATADNSQSAEMTILAAPVGTVAFDFDGDGKADLARRKPSNSEWKIKKSAANGAITTVTVGTSAAKPAPADFDGDGITDPATFTASNGFWTGVTSSNGATVTATFGVAGDIPVPADYDGDGHSDLAVFRPSTGVWWVAQSSNGVTTTTAFGTAGDIPVPGNYDGDGRADFAVFRPSNGTWYTLGSTTGYNSSPWGLASDVPVAADYDGDRKTDFAVFRPSSGSWYVLKSSTGATFSYWNFNWGNYGDQPAPADYDGDGKADLAVYRPTTNVWHIERSCAYTNVCAANTNVCAANTSPYLYQSFGAAGDQAVESAYLKQVGGQVSGDALNAARLSPKNATGGTDLYSQNFSWGTSLAGLPGRAGLNAGFGIAYNSLVWTKFTEPSTNTPTVVYDADQSNVTPGFQFGFPTIEPAYFDAASSTFNYLMVSPSGSRTRFVQLNGASDTYETQDSSYLQLKTTGAASANDPAENITITVSGTDGTRMTYLYKAGAFHCSEIKDRNGNYLTIVYDDLGLLKTVTDTLGRTITVYYDDQLYPSAITEQMQAENGRGASAAHTLVLFGYETMPLNPSFASTIAVIGPGAGATVRILRNIVYDSGANTFFYYNSFGQVYKVLNTAPDGHTLNYVKTNLADADLGQTAQTDAPRFTETRSWVENFNRAANNGAEQETVISNSLVPNQSYSVGGTSGTGTLIQVAMANEPNGHYSKIFVGAAGWQEGLPLATEDWANAANGGTTERKRWTNTVWTQDAPTLSAPLQNPRTVESRVGDTSNVKRMTTDYLMQGSSTTASYFGLPKEMKVYDADQTTVLKTAKSEYNLDAVYTNRRIIGLPAKSELTDQNGTLVSKMTYAYDEGDFSDSSLSQNLSTAVAHDNSNFGAAFIAGRANQTSMTRWNVESPTSASEAVTSRVKYNTTGAPVAQSDPLGRTVKINYADSFSDTVNRNTFAYPTTLTDPAGNSSTVKYRYDLGLNVWARSPAPAGNSVGKISTREFDSIGRISKESILNDQNQVYSYQRYEYPTSSVQSKSYATILDQNGNGLGDAADEVLSEAWSDGAGRVLRSRSIHPGSTGGFSGTFAEYDTLGQVKRQSVPTEIDANWNPAGDGATRGVLWNQQQYDWKGRALVSTATDGTITSASYDGCGCAGGAVITTEGEVLADGNRRRQRAYADTLGRQYKTEVLNLDGSVYSSAVTKFDGRDQAEWVKQYAGAAPADALTSDSCPVPQANAAETCQITKLTYDGHGRVKSQHAPQQDASKATVYQYDQADEVQQVKDARGATTAYTYNNRGLVTNITSTMPSAADMQTAQTQSVIERCGEDDNCGGTGGGGGGGTGGGGTGGGSHTPFGHLDGVNGANWTVTGWSLDQDTSNTSISVHFYLDGAAGTGTFIGSTTADKPRPDVNQATGQPGNHGFEFTIPNQYLDGRQHTIYAHGINTDGTPNNPVLMGSPAAFSFSPNTILPSLDTSTTIAYDNLGNRVSMTDNLGGTVYEYDQFSRLKAETRSFTDTTPNGSPLVMSDAPNGNNSFKLLYTYGLSNQLTALTDPYGMTVNYGYDPAGRLNNVTGTSFGGVTNYADNAKYQAWGALKELHYGSSLQMGMTYNNRLQADSYTLSGGTNAQVMSKHYNYYADGKLSYSQDLLDAKFDRLNIYDGVGRIKEGKSGAEARGQTVAVADESTALPYRQSYQFNAFGNLTERNNHHWGVESWYGQNNNLSYGYQNQRIQGAGWSYDADGRNLQSGAPDDYATSVFNAAGQMVRSVSEQTDALRYYDGGGREIKRQTANLSGSSNWLLQPIKYYIRSSVLGGATVSEIWANGKKGKTFISAAGSQLAYQSAYGSDTAQLNEAVFFEYSDASGMSRRTTNKLGQSIASGDNGEGSAVETDPLGSSVGTSTPYIQPENQGGGGYDPDPIYPMLQSYFDDAPSYVNGQRQTCLLDGFAIACSRAIDMLESGSAIPSALAGYQNLPGFSFESHGLGIFTAPDIYKNTTSGRVWAAAPGSNPDGVRIFQGGIITFPVSWSPQMQSHRVHGPSPEGDEPTKVNHCKWFGINAQRAADYVSKMENKNDEEKAYEFGRVVATWYTGGWWDEEGWLKYKSDRGGLIGNASKSKSKSGAGDPAWEGEAAKHNLLGNGGFKNEYLDSKDNNEDVTHHVAAYLALGATNAYLKNGIVSLGDRISNDGDYKAASDSYNLGSNIYNKWSNYSTIGADIQKTFCNSTEDFVPAP